METKNRETKQLILSKLKNLFKMTTLALKLYIFQRFKVLIGDIAVISFIFIICTSILKK